MIGQSEKSGIEIESEYQLTGHPVIDDVQWQRFSFIYCVALPQLHNLFYCLAFLLLLDMVSAIVKTDPHNYKSSVVSKSQGMLWPIISQNRITSVTTQYLSPCRALDWLLGRML